MDVEPEAAQREEERDKIKFELRLTTLLNSPSAVEKFLVSFPRGRLSIKGEILTLATLRPSSARIFVIVGRVETNSRPSPAI